MEVETPQPITSFWRRYRRWTLFVSIGVQIVAVLVVGLALLVGGLADSMDLRFWLMLAGMLIVTISVNAIMLPIITEPLKQLSAAIASADDERTTLTPPNPNVTRFAKNGLKPLLQKIYELGANEPKKIAKPTDKKIIDAEVLDQALANSSASILFFDDKLRLAFSSKGAPITHRNDEGGLDLLFYTDTPFQDWAKECLESAVNTTYRWSRIPNRPIGDEDRKLYDVIGTYHKGESLPFSLIVIEKTKEYGPEDDDLSFISFAAHELRGPITVINGYIDTLNDELSTVTTDEQKELFERLIVSANRLSSYINNILNSARYDRRHLSMQLIKTSISHIYGLIADDMQLRAQTQRRFLQVDLPASLPPIAADPSSLSEVVGNLIDNALKYSNEGGTVTVIAEVHGTNLEVTVKDTGIGMPANVVENLFHKFYRSHRSRETVAGTGIGLYISKAIVESHGGTIQARSIEGEGSTFTFSVPLYESVADKLARHDGDNRTLISTHGGSWIKNHGSIRG